MSSMNLVPFAFEDCTIRVITDDNGETLFVAKDVATALGYSDTDDAVRSHCKHMILLKAGELTGLGMTNPPSRGLTVIPESDVYRLTMRSQLESADRFQDWVCEKVIPSIRKTGGYQAIPMQPFTTEQRAAELTPAFMQAAKAFGFEGNQAILSADKAIKAITGISPLGLMGHTNLIAPKQEVLLTPTDIGNRLGASAAIINTILDALGLQNSYRDLKGRLCHELTEAGKAFGEYLDTGKKHTDGTPVRQIKWNASVIDVINHN